MPKPRKWPPELRKKIIEQELAQREAPLGLLSEKKESEVEARQRLTRNYLDEIRRRTELILAFFKIGWPESDAQWLSLLMKVCDHWEIPAYRIEPVASRGRGASKSWTDQRNCELFADVNALVARGMSEYSACQHIAKNPQLFKNRYKVKPKPGRKAKNDGSTLHRQYERVKKQIQTDALFRLRQFCPPMPIGAVPVALGLLSAPDYGPDLITEAIRRYGVTQES
jgi:hypothetical protein